MHSNATCLLLGTEQFTYLVNVEYLAKNNGLSDSNEALQKLVQSDWGSCAI